jgi:NADPH-dependent 2,4-dienoyl-CoA reductase/sulfur reductase-like enzyme
MVKVVIIGGSDAGIAAAMRAREVLPSCEVVVVVADKYPNFSICGLPYFLSGEVPDWRDLAHRTVADIEAAGVRLMLGHTARFIDTKRKTVSVSIKSGKTLDVEYDRLVLATGALPILPSIPGMDLDGVFPLRFMDDSFALQSFLTKRAPTSAAIIGGGYIGLEMAESLTRRGVAVTVIERGRTVLKTLSSGLGDIVQEELMRHGVKVVNNVTVSSMERSGEQLRVNATGYSVKVDLALVAVGVMPNVALAESAGLVMGTGGAIAVNRFMETSELGVYAAGDCAETWHRLLQTATYMPLGSTAHKQGRAAGENAVGGKREFIGTIGTQVVKVFDLAVARTGIRGAAARIAGLDPLTIDSEVWDHKAYYPGAHSLRIRVTGDCNSGILLGAQIVGHHDGEVAKRIDIFATAIHHGMSVDGLSNLDLSYTPPFGSPWDAVQIASQAWVQKHDESRIRRYVRTA